MLDLKGVRYDLVEVRPPNQRLHLRLAGFPAGTVPTLKLDGRKVQGSRAISRALDERWPDPELRRWAVHSQRLPAPEVLAAAIRRLVSHYARTIEADGRPRQRRRRAS
jgi:glutathione S-transferase